MDLKVERKIEVDRTTTKQTGNIQILAAPMVDETYWTYRVKLSESQAIIGFPKFFTTGIGFAKEEDWNTNLPWMTPTEKIFNHIKHNKGDESIKDSDVIRAIKMIREAIYQDSPEEVRRHAWEINPNLLEER